jgi:tetratricopeptide (TPR) repeat protein
LIPIIFNIEILFTQEIYDEGFADYLFREGEYYRAITEYYRLIYQYTDSTKKTELFKNIGLCYYYGADYQRYITFFNKKQHYFETKPTIRTEMELYLGKSYYHLNNYQTAISTLEWSDISLDNSFFSETQFFLGIVYSRAFNWQKAIEKMQSIEQDSPYKAAAENFSRSLQNSSKLPEKKPVLAGILSAIIPGSGYIYSNRVGTGISALVINGLLIWTISDAIKKEQYGLATTAGFFGIGWYVGNIKGSVDAANGYNTHIRNEFIDTVLEKENLDEYLKN